MIRKQTARTRSRGICTILSLAMLALMPTSIHATESGATPESAASLNAKWESLERKAEEAFIKGDLELSRKNWQEAATVADQEKSQELNLATTLNQLNHLYTRTGEYEKSFTNLHRALDIRQRLLKRDDVLIAETMGNLAIVCDALHRRHEAEEWFQKSLEIKRAVLKPDAPELAVTMHNLARLYAGEKRYKESIELLNQALDIDQKHYGEKHIEIVRDLTTLGISCYECQEFDEAIRYLERALALANEMKDDRKSDLIPIHHYLGLSCAHTKQHEKAHKHYTSAFELGKHVHGEGHHKNTPALLNLAKGNDKLGKTEAALTLYKEAVAIEEKRSPKDEYLLTDCLVELGHFYQSHNQVKEAESAYRKAFASYETLPRDAKRRLYELPVSLSALLRKQGKNEEAEEVSRRYLHVHTPHGEEHFKL